MQIKRRDSVNSFEKPIFVVARGRETHVAGGLHSASSVSEPGFYTTLQIIQYTGLVLHYVENRYLNIAGTKFYYAGMAFKTTEQGEAVREF